MLRKWGMSMARGMQAPFLAKLANALQKLSNFELLHMPFRKFQSFCWLQAADAYNPLTDVVGDSLTLSTAGLSSNFIVKVAFQSSRATPIPRYSESPLLPSPPHTHMV
jgi:hypothetical protein